MDENMTSELALEIVKLTGWRCEMAEKALPHNDSIEVFYIVNDRGERIRSDSFDTPEEAWASTSIPPIDTEIYVALNWIVKLRIPFILSVDEVHWTAKIRGKTITAKSTEPALAIATVIREWLLIYGAK